MLRFEHPPGHPTIPTVLQDVVRWQEHLIRIHGNGPWMSVSPYDVPLFILRVPVTYYVRPPHFFVGWHAEQAPHWGEHWGRDWERGHRGWDNWDRARMPRPAPLPNYQRRYERNNYPRSVQQEYEIPSEHFSYRPHEEFNQRYLNRPRSDERVQRRPRENRRQTDEHVQATRPQIRLQDNRPQPDARSQVRPDANRQQQNLHRRPQGQQTQSDRRHDQPNMQLRSNGRRQACISEKQNSDTRCKAQR